MRKIACVLLLSSILCISCGRSDVKKGSVSEYRLQFLTQNSETEPVYQGALAFARKLDELSSSTMIVEFNKVENITKTEQLIEPIRTGEYDVVITGYTTLTYAIPEIELVAQAYVVTSYENFIKTLDSDYGRKINNEIAKLGLVASELWFLGTRHTTSNNPINSLKDFKGLRLRTPPTDANIEFAEAMGTIAMPISLSQLYSVLDKQYVNAQENPLSTIEAHKIYEVQKYIAITSHLITASSLFINKNTYNSFSPQQEAWFNEAVEYGRQVCYDIVSEEEKYLLEKFENEYGMIVTYPDIDELKKAMYPIYDKIEEKYGKDSVYSLVNIK